MMSPFPCQLGPSVMIDGSLTEAQAHHASGPGEEFIQGAQAHVTIYMLPDLALLEIFDFYVHETWVGVEVWHTLVHVCRKWRNIVFNSPCRLDLRLYYSARRPLREMLDVWPLLPIVIMVRSFRPWSLDNLVAALKHNDRICELDLSEIRGGQLEKIWAAMQQPFPALTRLEISPVIRLPPSVPASFLGGSAPRLRSLSLQSIPFPGVLDLLLSSTQLTHLHLWRIPHSEYFSPEEIATCLSALTRLERFGIGFESPLIRPDRRNPPPQTLTLLPFLTGLWFEGFSEYLEDLVARIDAPLLNKLVITFLREPTFDTPQLAQFISRAPKFKPPDEARVVFSKRNIYVTLPQAFDTPMKLPMDRTLKLIVSCTQPDQQLSSLAQVCSSCFPQAFISAVEHLYIIEGRYSELHWQGDIGDRQWLEFLHPFTSVKSLYISEEFIPRIEPALQELVGERVTQVLPVLQALFLEERHPSGSIQGSFGQFIVARQLDNHPVVISRWEREYFE